jgi:hypothetical protein
MKDTILLTLALLLFIGCRKTGEMRKGTESTPAAAMTETTPEQSSARGKPVAPVGMGDVPSVPVPRAASAAASGASAEMATVSGDTAVPSAQADSVSPGEAPKSPPQAGIVAADASADSGKTAVASVRTGSEAAGETEAPLSAPTAVYAKLREVNVPNPVIDTPSGVFAAAQTVRIDCALKEALIRYTLDGSTPSSANGLAYSGPVKIDASKILKALAYIPGGNHSEAVMASYAIGELFARPMRSVSSTAWGTIDSPVEGLGRALTESKAKGLGMVKAQAGTYSERVDISNDIILKGGYSPDFAVRDMAKHASVLAGTETRGATQASPGYSIRFSGSSVSAKTLLEGFTVKGGDANFCAAVVVADRASPVIRSCSLAGGTGGYTYGLRCLTQAAPRIESSFIDGGDGGSSFGISADGAAVVVVSCTIVPGTGTAVSYGIALTSSKASVSGSVIEGGRANSSYGVAAYSAPELSLFGCTISGGRGNLACAVFIASSGPDIRNCLLFTRGTGKAFGIYENYGDSDPKILEGNCIFDCPSGLYYDQDTRKAFAAVSSEGLFVLPDGTAMTTPRGKANISVTPILGPAPDLRTSPDSPEAVRRGGVSLASGLDLDRDGRRRTAPYSIGAYEVD